MNQGIENALTHITEEKIDSLQESWAFLRSRKFEYSKFK